MRSETTVETRDENLKIVIFIRPFDCMYLLHEWVTVNARDAQKHFQAMVKSAERLPKWRTSVNCEWYLFYVTNNDTG